MGSYLPGLQHEADVEVGGGLKAHCEGASETRDHETGYAAGERLTSPTAI